MKFGLTDEKFEDAHPIRAGLYYLKISFVASRRSHTGKDLIKDYNATRFRFIP